ncbi:MAG: carboxypeptidase regulatory-like domain-containing protein, partial [Pseudomonadota bacterium]
SITVPLSDPASPIEDALWSYVNGAYVMTDRMVPWEGYYIYNLGVSPVTLLIPNPSPVSGEGSLQVTVVDALTGDSLEGVTVTLNGFTATTDTLGIATLSDTPSGTFTLTVSKSGYITHQQEITLEVGPNDLTISLSPQLATGQIRIVLNWGATPSDLDSHLTGPNASGGRFHVYFADENPAGAGANLDLDDVTSFGPETITITELRSGTYKYYIHDFSNQSNSSSTALAQSGARVDVYGESGLIASYSVPSGAGTIWHVLNIDGGTGSVTPVNTLSSGEVPLDSMLSDGSGEGMGFEGIEMEDIFRNLPPKSD